MKFSITFVLFVFAVQVFSLTCPTFKCVENFTSNTTCASKTMEENIFSVKIKPCTEQGKVCPFTENLDEDDICADPVMKMYPGEYCSSKKDCIQGECTANICVGNAVDTDCASHIDCAAGLFCLNKKCAKLLEFNNTCNQTYLCQVGLICAGNVCTKIGSIENEKEAVVPATCKSYYMENGVCSEGPILNETEKKLEMCPGECHYGYKVKKDTFVEGCVCGMTNNSLGICRPGEGDYKLEDVNYNSKFLGYCLY